MYYYGSLVDYAIDMSKLETYALLLMWLVTIFAENMNAGITYLQQQEHVEFVKVFLSFFLSVCQLNCLRTSKGLSLGELIHLQRIYFSKHLCPCFGL